MKTKKIAIYGVVAALYAVLTMANPISFGMLQLRISTMLIPLTFFDPMFCISIGMGTTVASMLSPMGLVDALVGVSICLLCFGYTKFDISKVQYALIYSVTSAALVAAELSIILGMPFLLSFCSVFASSLVLVSIGFPLCGRIYKEIKIFLDK